MEQIREFLPSIIGGSLGGVLAKITLVSATEVVLYAFIGGVVGWGSRELCINYFKPFIQWIKRKISQKKN
jgi:hypothetical protein